MTTSSIGSRRFAQCAFTLIEVLVTVVILFAGVAVVLRCYAGAIRGLDAAERTVKADQFMGQRMAEAELLAAQGQVPRTDGGWCPAPRDGYTWQQRVSVVPLVQSGSVAQVVVTLSSSKVPDRHVISSEFIVTPSM